jgi:Fe-S-cluster-containing dehydrogenase component/DMSO reductase anchor subunit
MDRQFIFDTNRCVGCRACVVACANKNNGANNNYWRKVSEYNSQNHPLFPVFYISMACNHCETHPCLTNCPANAYSLDSNNAVIHNSDKCIGCRYCTWVCPYNAPVFNGKTAVVSKCTSCTDNLSESDNPACTEVCPLTALTYKTSDNTKDSMAGVPYNKKAKPNIRFNEIKSRNVINKKVSDKANRAFISSIIKRKNRLKEEIPLLVFTVLFIIVTAAKIYNTFSDNIITDSFNDMHLFCTGAIAMLISFLHLGKKDRSYRAILNLKHSWLSREILLSGLFNGALFITYFTDNLVANIIAITIGVALIISIDMVYLRINNRIRMLVNPGSALSLTVIASAIIIDNTILTIIISSVAAITIIFDIIKSFSLNIRVLFRVISVIAILCCNIISNYNIILCLVTFIIIERAWFYYFLPVLSTQERLNKNLLKESNKMFGY